MLRNYEERSGVCPPGIEIACPSAFGKISRHFRFFPLRPTTIYTYLPSTSSSCLDASQKRCRLRLIATDIS